MQLKRPIRKLIASLALLSLLFAAIGAPFHFQNHGSLSDESANQMHHAHHMDGADQSIMRVASAEHTEHHQIAGKADNQAALNGDLDCAVGDCCPPTMAAIADVTCAISIIDRAFDHLAPPAPLHADIKLKDRPPRLS